MAKAKSFYSRYRAGEHELVWKELCALGADVFERPLYPDALRVCREVVRRARRNLRTLHRRLLSLGYEFKHPDAALVDADSDAVARLEEKVAAMPRWVRGEDHLSPPSSHPRSKVKPLTVVPIAALLSTNEAAEPNAIIFYPDESARVFAMRPPPCLLKCRESRGSPSHFLLHFLGHLAPRTVTAHG